MLDFYDPTSLSSATSKKENGNLRGFSCRALGLEPYRGGGRG